MIYNFLDYKILKLANEIIKLTDQQAKHRADVAIDNSNKVKKKFIRVVGTMILTADKKLQVLIEKRNNK